MHQSFVKWIEQWMYFRYPLKKDDVPESGALASCAYSSAEKGKVIVDKVLPELVNICKKEFNL